jgi:site-specific recombinase XerD
MSEWRGKFIDEMDLRGLDEKTKRVHVRSMEIFIEFHGGKDPEDLDLPEIKAYQRHLVIEKKMAPNSVNRQLTAIRQFYRQVMARHWYADSLPRVKASRHMPVVLSESEIAAMIDSVHKVFYKAIIMVTYSAGLRNSEVRNLKPGDIDSKRMVIHIRDGKGKRDRQALLSPLVLQCLRTYWRLYRLRNEVKSEWLFMLAKARQSGEIQKQLSHTALSYIITTAAKAAGIKKKYIPTFFAIHSPFTVHRLCSPHSKLMPA